MGDSDEDYIDIGEEVDIEDDTEESVGLPEKNGKSRGKDIEWIEIARYEDKAAYENSTYFLDIKKYFTMRKGRENCYSDNEHFTCKYSSYISMELENIRN